jgi:methylenetetrahydrofolate reductase (NADPH)
MKIIDLINKGELFFSIEITSPYKNKPIDRIFRTIERILPYNPAFINITYHSQKKVKTKIDGISDEIMQSAHVNQVGLCAAVKYKYNVEVVPHFVCAGLNKSQVEESLFDLAFLQMNNVLALRGDAAEPNESFIAAEGGYSFASELVHHISQMKQKHFVNKLEHHKAVDFCIGVAGYPEKHYEASDIGTDIDNLKKKIDAGAEFIITQICFNTDKFAEWLNLCRKAGINVPIIPGIKPLTSVKQMTTLRDHFHIEIPSEFVQKLSKATTEEDAFNIGIELSLDLCNKFIKLDAPGLHFFTMGNGKDVEEIAKTLFLKGI